MGNRIMEFMECASYRTEPGTPDLCPSCLHNREVITILGKRIKFRDKLLKIISATVELRP